MADNDADTASDEITVLIPGYPVLGGFIIGMVSSLFTIGVVALTIRSWQLLVQDGAVPLPGIIGAVVAFGTILVVSLRVD